jgi:hypothetical protein
MPDSHNDINVLQRSSIFVRLVEGQGPQVKYNINNNNYSMSYYLADKIYLSWTTFVKTIPEPQGNKKKYSANVQEACRKDVERAFGVLQSRFAIVRGSAHLCDEDLLGNIIMACITMHNMMLKMSEIRRRILFMIRWEKKLQYLVDAFIANYRKIKDNETHTQLQADTTCGIIIQIYTILVVIMSDFILCLSSAVILRFLLSFLLYFISFPLVDHTNYYWDCSLLVLPFMGGLLACLL